MEKDIRQVDRDAGSRMHLLDWLESPDFFPVLRELVRPAGFTVSDDAAYQPKGRHDHRESVLAHPDPFLSLEDQKKLADWWLVYQRGGKGKPTWDLVVSAKDPAGTKALILVEAKGHASELNASGKEEPVRDTREQQERSKANHQRIASAIAEAQEALCRLSPAVLLSRDENYQFANRVAYSWKLASLGVPVAMVYLGFVGDLAIAEAGDAFATAKDWRRAFQEHTAKHFPTQHLETEIQCGPASFWLLLRSLDVLRQSPSLAQRREKLKASKVRNEQDQPS